MINNKRYTKVYKQFCYSATDCGEKRYYAAVREDTLNAKIYCIQTYDGVERLIADFDVQTGDAVTVHTFWPFEESLTVYVQSVDSILIDNQYRKRINISNGYDHLEWGPTSWIEGIGSTGGLFFPFETGVVDLGDPPVLLCFHVDDVLIYQHPWVSSCYFKSRINVYENKPTILFKVYPTIAEDYLYIEQEHLFSLYRIYNNLGVCVQSGRLSETSVSVSALIAGFYYIVFYNEDAARIYSAKFIKR
jgi:hypothetical protein